MVEIKKQSVEGITIYVWHDGGIQFQQFSSQTLEYVHVASENLVQFLKDLNAVLENAEANRTEFIEAQHGRAKV